MDINVLRNSMFSRRSLSKHGLAEVSTLPERKSSSKTRPNLGKNNKIIFADLSDKCVPHYIPACSTMKKRNWETCESYWSMAWPSRPGCTSAALSCCSADLMASDRVISSENIRLSPLPDSLGSDERHLDQVWGISQVLPPPQGYKDWFQRSTSQSLKAPLVWPFIC